MTEPQAEYTITTEIADVEAPALEQDVPLAAVPTPRRTKRADPQRKRRRKIEAASRRRNRR